MTSSSGKTQPWSLLQLAMGMVFWIALCKRFREFAVWFAMEHFQLRKPRNKSQAESRGLTSEAGRATARTRYEGFGKKLGQKCESLSRGKNAIYARFWEFSSWTCVLDSTNLTFSGNLISPSSTTNLAKILRKAQFMEIRMRRPHSLTHGQLSQHCGFLPQNSRIGHFLQSSQAVQ